MKKHSLILLLLILFTVSVGGKKHIPYLKKQGIVTQRIVDNNSFLIVGGELGNSSALSVEDIECMFPHKIV